MNKKIKKAIISVYYKDGLEEIVRELHKNEVEIYSTGGSFKFIEDLGIPCIKVESLTNFPEILDGRVKTLHPAIFGGLLARSSNEKDIQTMTEHSLPFFDLMICNLYPFEEYIQNGAEEVELIEKIDIGGVTLIRAAAKNFNDVICISNPEDYNPFVEILKSSKGETNLDQRRQFAANAFKTIADYDSAISNYFLGNKMSLRYGENPHQAAHFEGKFDAYFTKHNGKEVSYNNILDIDAACRLMRDMDSKPTFAIMKHNNSCGLATKDSILEAYKAAFDCDPKSAFGGVLISNQKIDIDTATEMNSLFFEIIIAPEYSAEALEILKSKKNRIILQQLRAIEPVVKSRNVLNGKLIQVEDTAKETRNDWKLATKSSPTDSQSNDLEFGIIAVKHLKSNGIALVKNQQLIGMGCGQVSRIDALEHAIKKAIEFGFDLSGAVMCSDAFFPFGDCVEIAHKAGITSVAQPGGSMRDQDSIDFCDQNGMSMVMTGVRHFNH